MTIEVRNNPERHRYEILIADEVVGYADYDRQGDTIAIPHTFVDPDRRGENLARQLVGFALDDIRAQQLYVLPACPYVQRVIARNRDAYLDLVPAGDRAAYGLGDD